MNIRRHHHGPMHMRRVNPLVEGAVSSRDLAKHGPNASTSILESPASSQESQSASTSVRERARTTLSRIPSTNAASGVSARRRPLAVCHSNRSALR